MTTENTNEKEINENKIITEVNRIVCECELKLHNLFHVYGMVECDAIQKTASVFHAKAISCTEDLIQSLGILKQYETINDRITLHAIANMFNVRNNLKNLVEHHFRMGTPKDVTRKVFLKAMIEFVCEIVDEEDKDDEK